MRTTFAITGLLAALTTTVFAAPQTKGEGFIGEKSNDDIKNIEEAKHYIVLYEKNETTPIADLIKRLDDIDETVILRQFNNSQFYGAEILVGESSAAAFNAMAEVAIVEEKAEIKTFVEQQEGAPWGLQRISNEAGASGSVQGSFTYTFEDENLGAAVDIYIVDTGLTRHAVFDDRIQNEAFSFTSTATDGDGHGTHVAGTAAGRKFGVAQNANIIAVKVLGDDGSGSSADTIAGMDWVINRHNERIAAARSGGPAFKGSVMSMSWGLQGTASSVDRVVLEAIEAGIHVSVAAGNDGADACGATPAHNGGDNSAVVTVGAVNIDNQVSSFSNVGTCVDIYAPGEDILSAWNTGPDRVNFLSGTSMACPHVSGVMAYLLAQDENSGLRTNPAGLKSLLLRTARDNEFTGNTGGSDNKLLSNGVDGREPAKRLARSLIVPASNNANLGSPAARARDVVGNPGERWQLESEETQQRY